MHFCVLSMPLQTHLLCLLFCQKMAYDESLNVSERHMWVIKRTGMWVVGNRVALNAEMLPWFHYKTGWERWCCGEASPLARYVFPLNASGHLETWTKMTAWIRQVMMRRTNRQGERIWASAAVLEDGEQKTG